MKAIITGENGYIAKNTYAFFVKKGIEAFLVSVKNGIDNIDLKGIDTVVHCAALVHKKYAEEQYYRINRDLTFELAKKAKAEGVKQFVFLSTISVFGLNSGIINKDTKENPQNYYGKSKLAAEEKIKALEDDDFKITIVRAPMVYGKGCAGNYQRLRKLALKAPFFPDSGNLRSMIYIGNLVNFLYNAAIDCRGGIFYPQNKEYVNTFNLVLKISKCNFHKIRKLPFGKTLKNIKKGAFEKVFGSLIIDRELEKSNFDYCVYDFEKSIDITEIG